MKCHFHLTAASVTSVITSPGLWDKHEYAWTSGLMGPLALAIPGGEHLTRLANLLCATLPPSRTALP
jgi:hypothetical protein